MKQHNTRLMKGALTLLTIAMLTFTGCKKDEDTSPNSGKTVVKYEIISSVQVLTQGTSYVPTVSYANETGTQQTETIITPFTTWTKEVTLTTSQRPLPLLFQASGMINAPSGTVTMKIFVNNELRGTLNCVVTNMGGNTALFSGYIYNVSLN